jgi:hypothetical membrane protein
MRRVPAWAVVSSAAAPVFLIGGWTLAAALQPRFDSVAQTISALAGHAATHRWVMTTGLAGLGAAHVVTAAGLRPAAPAGRVVLAIGGAATLAVAALPLPATDGRPAHNVAAGIGFVALAAWPALSWRRGAAPVTLRPGLAGAAAVVLLATDGWFFGSLGTAQVGLAERVAAGAQALWPLAVVLTARRATQRGRRSTSLAPAAAP